MAESLPFEELCRTGRQQLKSGRAEEALRTLEEARQINDLDPDVHDGLATAHCLLGTLESAARHYERATRLDPRRGSFWINLGAVYNRLSNFQKAAEVLRRAVQIDRKNAIGFYNLGIAYKQLKLWNMAVPAYREAIRINPKMADAYLNLGNVYLAMGNHPQAALQFKKALELDPAMERATRGLEKAEAGKQIARESRNPFGRLVAEAGIDPGSSAELSIGRTLSDDERKADRRALRELFEQTRLDLDELLKCLKEQIDPDIKTLNRLLTHQASMHGENVTKDEALESFDRSSTAFAPRLRQFRRVLQQMRDHEANLK